MKTPVCKILPVVLAVTAALSCQAEIQVFDLSDAAGELAFQEAVAELNLLTSDVFGSFAPPPGEMHDLGARLAPGESNGPLFPNGSPVEYGLTIQNNFDHEPDAPNPMGLLSAYRHPDTGSLHFTPYWSAESLDIIVDPPGAPGGARALVFDTYYVTYPENTAPGTGELRIYDADNELLGLSVFENLEHSPVARRIGIVASDESTFHRLNWWTGHMTWGEIGHFGIYAIPEPATVGLLTGLLGVALIAVRRRKRSDT